MLKKNIKIFGFIIILLAVIFPYRMGQAEDSWKLKMQKLESILSRLLPLVSSEKQFLDPKNKKQIETDLKQLVLLTHGLAKPMTMEALPPDADPSIPLLLSVFEDEMQYMGDSFQKGHGKFTRHLLQNLTGYCITCHTRTNQGVQQRIIPVRPNLGLLTTFERAEYFAATRHFDGAIIEYQKIINDPQKAKKNPDQWQKALRNTLAITVRFKRDLEKSLALVEEALKTPELNEGIKLNLVAWKKSIQDWKNEAPIKDVKPQTLETKIKELLEKSNPETASNEQMLIEYLRVSSLAHDLLRLVSTSSEVAQALYFTGVAHASLEEGPVYFMPEMYFEACIKKSPHTSISKKCYRAYEERMIKSYSGSSGINFPEGVEQQINRVKKMAY